MIEEYYKKLVHNGYESKEVIENYSIVGLYKTENVLVHKFFPKQGSILDIGCGAGRTTIPLSQSGYKVCGIDLSPYMINAAKEQSKKFGLEIDFYEMNAKNLNFADESFDGAIFSANGFDHVPGYDEKIEVFREVYRVLKPGAPFIFSIHGMWCAHHFRKLVVNGLKASFGKLTGSTKLYREWGEFDDKAGYMSFMNLNKWDQAIKDSGYNIIFRQSRYEFETKLFVRSLYHKSKSISHNQDSPKRYCIGCGNFIHYVVSKPTENSYFEY